MLFCLHSFAADVPAGFHNETALWQAATANLIELRHRLLPFPIGSSFTFRFADDARVGADQRAKVQTQEDWPSQKGESDL